MKSLNEMPRNEQLSAVFGSKTLRRLLDETIYADETSYIDDKLDCFPRGSIEYQYGACCHCYIKVKDPDGFMDGVKKSVNMFGGSTRLETAIDHCIKLRGSNLWEHHVKKMSERYFQEEVMTIIEYLESISYAIYRRDVGQFEELAGDYFDLFVANGHLDGLEMDENGRIHEDRIIN